CELRHRFAKIEEIDDLSFEITAVTFSEGCFHAAYSLIPWSNILAHLTEIPLPHRDEAGKSRYRYREWTHLKLGTLYLKPGSATLTLEALSLPGIDLKHVKLTRR
ncbi:MAG: hypothetical protein NTX35_01360, partial [Verrucomicrobia bacterium]|nr:hypothetical protein [Verrucomicrobiota bacterium]